MKLNLLALICLVCLSGCAHVNEWQIHDRFGGVRAIYEANRAIDILVVHGMGQAMDGSDGAYAGYSLPMQRELARGLQSVDVATQTRLFPIITNGVLLGTVLMTTYEDAPRNRKLTFYELSWAEAVKPMKTVLLELDGSNRYRETNPLEKHRARLNSLGKAFVNTHLADPVIYSGGFGATLRGMVAEAVCILTRAAPEPGKPCDFRSAAKKPAPIAIVTISLGSALVFDTLNELVVQGRDQAAAAIQVASATSQMYMLANQVPLLELRALQTPTKAEWLDDYPCPKRGPAEAASDTPQGLSGFLEIRRLGSSLDEAAGLDIGPLAITAFSDPNDLLTYFISDRFKTHCKDVSFANVTVTSANTVWFFLVADPFLAHSGYIENKRVMQMILDGGSP